MRNVLLLLVTLGLVPVASAQSGLSPVIQNVRLGKHGLGRGEFRILNKGLTPLAVTLEVKSVEWRNGKMFDVRPLDNGCVVEISETSTLVPIRSEHTIGFNTTCSRPVNYFEIFCVMKPVRKNGAGIAIASAIGESVYACRKGDCRTQYWAMPEHGSGLPKSGLTSIKTEPAKQ